MPFFYLYFCELYIIFSLVFFFYPHLPSHNCVLLLNAFFVTSFSSFFLFQTFKLPPSLYPASCIFQRLFFSVSLLSSFFTFSFPSICLTPSSVICSPIAPSTSSSVCPKEALATMDWLCSCWGPLSLYFTVGSNGDSHCYNNCVI